MVVVVDSALVLHRYPWSESSLVAHVLTRNHGRVHVLAKGAYRTTSRYFAVLDLFDELELEWDHSPRRELNNLRAGSIRVRRRAITRDLASFRVALTELELANLAARDASPDRELYDLLSDSFDALETGAEPAELELVRFELAFLGHLGLAPALVHCAACGNAAPPVIQSPKPRAAFSAGAGGRLCRRCADEARAAGRRVGTLPCSVLDDGRILATREATMRTAFASEHVEGSSADTDDGHVHERGETFLLDRGSSLPADDLDRSGQRAAFDHARIDRVRDFVGRFLDFHLETRPRSHLAFLSAPNRNAPQSFPDPRAKTLPR